LGGVVPVNSTRRKGNVVDVLNRGAASSEVSLGIKKEGLLWDFGTRRVKKNLLAWGWAGNRGGRKSFGRFKSRENKKKAGHWGGSKK